MRRRTRRSTSRVVPSTWRARRSRGRGSSAGSGWRGSNGLGMGGTNVHVVLQEAPEPRPTAVRATLMASALSARSARALRRASIATLLADHLTRTHDQDLADIAFTLQVGRALFGHRRVCVANDAAGAAAAFAGSAAGEASSWPATIPREVAGSPSCSRGSASTMRAWWRGCTRPEPVFRWHLRHVLDLLAQHSTVDVLDRAHRRSRRRGSRPRRAARPRGNGRAVFAERHASRPARGVRSPSTPWPERWMDWGDPAHRRAGLQRGRVRRRLPGRGVVAPGRASAGRPPGPS